MLRTLLNGSLRVGPITPPYAPDVQAVFDKIMPAGVPPLATLHDACYLRRTSEASIRLHIRSKTFGLLDPTDFEGFRFHEYGAMLNQNSCRIGTS